MRKNIIPAVLLLCLSLTIPAAEPNFDRMELWRKNSTQGSTMAISRDTEEKAIRFDVKFQPETDFWAYPEFKLPEGIPAGKNISYSKRNSHSRIPPPDTRPPA